MMKKMSKWVVTTLLVVSLMGTMVFAETDDYGHIGAENDESFTLEEMLEYAIEDEYMAKYEYEALISDLGADRPFTNILEAENAHISALEDLYAVLGYSIPEVDPSTMVVVPDSIEEALEIGIEAEIANIAMYDLFLAQELPEEVRSVFLNLQKASESHLAAFRGDNGNGASTNRSAENGNGRNNATNSTRINGRSSTPQGSGFKVNGQKGNKNASDECILN